VRTWIDTIRPLLALASLALVAASPSFAQPAAAPAPGSETRFALVIGNGDYPNVPLKNPANDARDLAKALAEVGFSVSLVVDGDLAAMNRAIRDFGNAIKRPDAVALFYYSGHGVQYRGANYLVPARSDIQAADELPYAAVNAEQVYAKMESAGDRTNIIVLDACRNNPFPGAERAGERGLAVVGNVQPPQSLIVYATAPGKTAQDGEGRNGVFTAAFIRHLKEPGLDVELMIRKVREDVIAATGGAQVPWHNSSIAGAGFSFAKPEAPRQAAAAAPAPTASPPGAAGVLAIRSDPPGIDVVIDGDRTYRTPFSLDVAPGAHSFEPLATKANRTYYLGESKQWIAVPAGAEVSVPLKPKAGSAKLAFRLVPDGYDVYVDGEKAGTTPLLPIDVKAGGFEVRLERGGERPQFKNFFPAPGETAVVVWGATSEQAVELPRRTVKLDGKPDSWEGLDPLFEALEAAPEEFMGQAAYGIRRVFVCKDDRYLYWRIDFNERNPLADRPKGMGNGIILLFDAWFEGLRRNFSMIVQYNALASRTETSLGSWDDIAKKWSDLASGAIAVKQAKDTLAARLDLAWIEKHCGDEPAKMDLQLANLDANWGKTFETTLRLGFVALKK